MPRSHGNKNLKLLIEILRRKKVFSITERLLHWEIFAQHVLDAPYYRSDTVNSNTVKSKLAFIRLISKIIWRNGDILEQ